MKVRLLKDSRILCRAGEIVEVSPEAAAFLMSIGSAKEVKAAKAEPAAKKTTKK